MELVLVSTPIGNLNDISKRAIETLACCDAILVEDPHVSLKLLNYLKIKKPLITYQKFNENEVASSANSLFKKYNKVALITDAGTPAISDPGSIIVAKCRELGIKISTVPGACAVACAASLSGDQNTHFVFLGFFPRIAKEQKELLNEIYFGNFNHYIFYESPKRLLKTLKLFDKNFVNEIRVFNDLTKLHEQEYVGSLCDVIEKLENNPNTEKGEYVISINITPQKQEIINSQTIESLLVEEMFSKNVSLKEAINFLAEKGLNKNQIKKCAINLKEKLK